MNNGKHMNRFKDCINETFDNSLSIFKNNGGHWLLRLIGQKAISKLYDIFEKCDTISFLNQLYEYSRIITDIFYYMHDRMISHID